MNRHANRHQFDTPSDNDVRFLVAICRDASHSSRPPNAALFESYESFFASRDLDTARDPTIFRWLMRVIEVARSKRRGGAPLDYERCLKSLLKKRNIIVKEWEGDTDETVSELLEVPLVESARIHALPFRRRVSFDDARLDETWLSEHSRTFDPEPGPAQIGRKNQPRLRGRNFASSQYPRSRSTSNQVRRHSNQYAETWASQITSHSEIFGSEYPANPTPLFQRSHTELDQNADAFLEISSIRTARHCLHVWHDRMLLAQGWRMGTVDIASTHDRRTLLKQSLDSWIAHHRRRSEKQKRKADLKSVLEAYTLRRNRWLLVKAFSHWDESARHQKRATAVAQRHIMKVKYFNRWRRIAVENAHKLKKLQTQKCFNRWRSRIVQQGVDQEHAVAHREEFLLQTYFRHLLWTFCSRRVEGWRDQHVQRASFDSWFARLEIFSEWEYRADTVRSQTLARHTLSKLANNFRQKRQLANQAEQHGDKKLAVSCLRSLSRSASLSSLVKTTSDRGNLNLMRTTMKVWRQRLSMSHQASSFRQKRILQSTWTSWNDALRCTALEQQIDERVVVESLYKWVVQQRLRSFQKSADSRTLRRTMSTWTSRCNAKQSALEFAAATYEEQQRQRHLKTSMLSLYSSFRARENASRVATEFANARSTPKALGAWVEQNTHYQQLDRWAADARFYCLTTTTLRTWRSKTSEHQHKRRREAYARVRSGIKFRIVRNCFAQWHARTRELVSLQDEADRRQEARLIRTGVRGFDVWREQAAVIVQLGRQAEAVDHQKLMSSAMSAMLTQHINLSALAENAYAFRQETDTASLSVTLKRIQWATFTASRLVQTADALLARNRDQHIKHMLRHMLSQASRRRTAKSSEGQQEPESPSLRPASRLAARSETGLSMDESTYGPPRTPAYMRTPSRARRTAGGSRFRALPTPAMATPMTFSSAFFATTPAPLSLAAPADESEDRGSVFEGLTPQITPFARKLRAGGVTPARSALRSSVFGNVVGDGRNVGGTGKSVRFVRSGRFSGGRTGRTGG